MWGTLAQRFCFCVLFLASVQIPLALELPFPCVLCRAGVHRGRVSQDRVSLMVLHALRWQEGAASTPVAEIGSHVRPRRLLAHPLLLEKLSRDFVALLSGENSISMARLTRSFF